VHNKVNARLSKPEFDCDQLDYDCGFGDEKAAESEKGTATLSPGT
jgi:hypothetical protein